MHLKAYAKINPFLEINGLRDDGYHELSLIFRPVSLCDELDVELIDGEYGKVKLSCSTLEFAGGDNIIHKAYNALNEYCKAQKLVGKKGLPAFSVYLEKNIPSGAGMGGGSSDASAFMLAVNYLACLDLPIETLAEIGAGVGADVPATLYHKTTYGEGIGEKLRVLGAPAKQYYIVIKPTESFNTGLMYRTYDEVFIKGNGAYKPHSATRILNSISRGDTVSEAKNYYNVFEKVVPRKTLIRKLKNWLLEAGALGSIMTGSGSCVIGTFDDKKLRDKAYKDICKSISKGDLPKGFKAEDIKSIHIADSIDDDSMQLHFVYVFKCNDGTLYTGWTTDIDARENAHNNLKTGAKYTHAHGGGEIVYYEIYNSKSDALKRERAIKKLTRAEKLSLIAKK